MYKLWENASGDIKPIRVLETQHIVNIINMIVRKEFLVDLSISTDIEEEELHAREVYEDLQLELRLRIIEDKLNKLLS